MKKSIRKHRRDRYLKRQELRRLDELAEKKIRASFLLSLSSWGGTRCPDCGTQIRPHQLIDISGHLGGAIIDGCHANHPGPCIEDIDWQDKACDRVSRRHRYLLRVRKNIFDL